MPIFSTVAAEPPVISDEVLSVFQAKTFAPDGPDRPTLPYRILLPAGFDPNTSAEARFPLVLFLHGAGERGEDNAIQLVHGAAEFARPSRRSQNPAFVVFPQCPIEKRWVESPWDSASGAGEFPNEPSETMDLVLKLVDKLATQYPIDPARMYVMGLSMGGQGTWYAATAPPQRFAAMIEVCGGGDPTWADRYQGIPIWGFHGDKDTVVPVARGREMIAAIAQEGHHPELRFTEYPEVGHNSWTQTFRRDDVFEWMFSQAKQTEEAVGSDGKPSSPLRESQ